MIKLTDEINFRALIKTMSACCFCGKPNCTQKCVRCLSTVYCDRNCQVQHWPIHKKECEKTKQKSVITEIVNPVTQWIQGVFQDTALYYQLLTQLTDELIIYYSEIQNIQKLTAQRCSRAFLKKKNFRLISASNFVQLTGVESKEEFPPMIVIRITLPDGKSIIHKTALLVSETQPIKSEISKVETIPQPIKTKLPKVETIPQPIKTKLPKVEISKSPKPKIYSVEEVVNMES